MQAASTYWPVIQISKDELRRAVVTVGNFIVGVRREIDDSVRARPILFSYYFELRVISQFERPLGIRRHLDQCADQTQ